MRFPHYSGSGFDRAIFSCGLPSLIVIYLITHPSNVYNQFAFEQVEGWLVKLGSVALQHLPYSMRPTLSSPGCRSFLHNPVRYVLLLGHFDQVALSKLTLQSAWSQLKLFAGWNISSTLISWMAKANHIFYLPVVQTWRQKSFYYMKCFTCKKFVNLDLYKPTPEKHWTRSIKSHKYTLP